MTGQWLPIARLRAHRRKVVEIIIVRKVCKNAASTSKKEASNQNFI
jgi:hypothetical protein